MQAEKISNLLDSNSIQIFHTWNYGVRGEYEIWKKIVNDSTQYACFYQIKEDTFYLRIYQPYNFMMDFPCSILFDTAKFWQFNFEMWQDEIFRLTFVDIHGQDHITDTSIAVQKIFIRDNPFDTLRKLENIKNELGVYGISYQKNIGEFVEFWLSSQARLYYLPDNLHLNPKSEKYLLNYFGKGKTIKKNWNLHE